MRVLAAGASGSTGFALAPELLAAVFAAADNPVADTLARGRLGRNPTRPAPLTDLGAGFSFASWPDPAVAQRARRMSPSWSAGPPTRRERNSS